MQPKRKLRADFWRDYMLGPAAIIDCRLEAWLPNSEYGSQLNARLPDYHTIPSKHQGRYHCVGQHL
jgi:hypothetical protein